MKKTKTVLKKDDHIPIKEAILYGSAEIYGGGSATLISLVLLFYLNQILGINAAAAGAIIMVSKAWDAISDPLMGVISDNTRTKYGRRRPYMVIGGFLTFIAMIWLFAPIRDLTLGWKITLASVAYIFFCTANTVSQVPFCSLSSDISPNAQERNKANSIKLIFSMVGAAICYLVPSTIIDQQKEILKTSPGQVQMDVFLYIGVTFAFIFSLPLIISGIASKERTDYDKSVKSTFSFKSYRDPFKIRSYKWHLVMYICAFLCMDIISTLVAYYTVIIIPSNRVLFGNIKLGAMTLVAPMMITAGLVIPLALYISKKKSKQLAYRLGLPLYIIGGLGLCLYQPTWNNWSIPIFAIIMGLGFGGAQSMPWMIFPDTVDVAELKTGKRQTGTFSGLMTFSRKLTQAFAIFLVGIILEASGAKKDETGSIIAGSDGTAIAIRVMMAVTIILLISIGYFAATRYKVTTAKLKRVRYFIDQDREKVELTEEEKKEKDELIKELA